MPFVTGIELHGAEGGERGRRGSPAEFDPDVFEVRFVLHGKGVLRHHSDAEKDATVSTGDAILMRHGVATLGCLEGEAFREGGEGGEGGERGKDGERQGLYSMATFVTYMPRALVEPEGVSDEILGDFAPFGDRCVWRGRGRGDSSLSSVMDSDVLESMLSGAALWMERNEQTMLTTMELSSDEDDVAFESVDDVEATFATPDSTIAQDTDVNDIYHKQISASATYVLPNQTNRLALLFDPFADTPVPFVFGVEIFEPGHRTTPHVHDGAYEVFFILSGCGEGFCNGARFEVRAGDIVAFHPGSEHGIDNGMGAKMYCIEVMMPDEEFAEFVRGGQSSSLRRDELCWLVRTGCR